MTTKLDQVRQQREAAAMELLLANMDRIRKDMVLVLSDPVPLTHLASMTLLELGMAAGHVSRARECLEADLLALKALQAANAP